MNKKPMPRSWNRRRIVRPLAVRLEVRSRWQAMAGRRQLAGLTTRGTVPKRRLEGRLLRAEIDAAAVALAEVFESLPPAVQAKCLIVADRLSALRRKAI